MTPQQQRILTHLKIYGSITKLQGLSACRVLNVGDCIHQLRNQGWKIKTVMIKGVGNFSPYQYAEYVLLSKRRQKHAQPAIVERRAA